MHPCIREIVVRESFAVKMFRLLPLYPKMYVTALSLELSCHYSSTVDDSNERTDMINT